MKRTPLRRTRFARKAKRSVTPEQAARKSTKTALMKACDALVRMVVLLRDDEKCRRCGAGKREGRGFALQAAHIYGKGAHPAMRHDTRNVITLCQPCHYWWHQNGFGREAADRENVVRRWCIEILGDSLMALLDMLSRVRGRKTAALDLRRLALERELAALQRTAPSVLPSPTVGRGDPETQQGGL